MRDDLYEQLGVNSRADQRTIKAAYRSLAMRLHPDRTGDDADALARFLLVTEAWHILGDPARRAEYDSWLERHRVYVNLPELEHLPPHHARMSTRNVARRSMRRSSRSPSRTNRRVRPFLIRRVSRVSLWYYLVMCVLCLSCILPGVFQATRGLSKQRQESTPHNKLPPGESPLSPEEQKRNLRRYLERIRAAAQAGDRDAQLIYGNLLYSGIAGLEMEPDPEAAKYWWGKAGQPDRCSLHSAP